MLQIKRSEKNFLGSLFFFSSYGVVLNGIGGYCSYGISFREIQYDPVDDSNLEGENIVDDAVNLRTFLKESRQRTFLYQA